MTWRALRRRIAVIDGGSASVVAARFSRGRAGSLVLEDFALGRGEFEASGAESLDGELRKFAKGKGTTDVQLGLPGHVALTRFVRTPSIAKTRREKVAEFEATQAIPYPLEEVAWDYMVVADSGSELELMLAAVKRDAVNWMCDVVEAAGLGVTRAVPLCVALRECYRFNYPDEPGGVLLVDVGRRSTQLVYVEPRRFFARTLGWGGEENWAARVHGEIARSLLNAQRQGAAVDVRRILLTGGGALQEEQVEKLSALAKMPVARLDPLRRVELSAQARASGAEERAAELAGAVGLAAVAMGSERVPNLVPKAAREAAGARRRERQWLAMAALVAAMLVLPIWRFREATRKAMQATAEIETRLAPARATMEAMAAKREQLERVQAEITRLRKVAEAKTEWVRFLAKLQENLASVGDVWLDRLAIEEQETAGALRVGLSGRMLRAGAVEENAERTAFARVKRLLENLEKTERVTAVENPRFDDSRPGVLGFEVTLVLAERAAW